MSGDYGLLHAIDERLAAYGWETNTGVRLVAVVDMRGRVVRDTVGAGAAAGGLREGEMKLVCLCPLITPFAFPLFLVSEMKLRGIKC